MRLTTKYIKLLRELIALPNQSQRIFIYGRKAYKELSNNQLFCTVRDAVLRDADVSWHHDYYHQLRSRFGRFTKQERIIFQIAFGLHCGKEAFTWFQNNITCPTWAEARLQKARENAERHLKGTFKDGRVVRDPKTGRFKSNMAEYRKKQTEKEAMEKDNHEH